MSGINSESYWNGRFKQDWDANQGDQQSIFFMKMALDLFPKWLKNYLQSSKKTILDWGCAEGDGTNILSNTYPGCLIQGMDFAETAIDTANKRYAKENLSFIAKDLLKQNHETVYDVVFSSNVFEHFDKPWEVFHKIGEYAKDFFVILVPFNEDENNLIPEHFHSFKTEDFFLKTPEWILVYLEVKNTAEMADTQWLGEQVIAIYASKHIAGKMQLMPINTQTTNLKGSP